MKQLLLIPAIALVGCASNQYMDQSEPDQTIHIPHNIAVTPTEDDGSKGKFPPGRSNNRVINYNGHGLGYNDYHVDNFHRKYYKENGISPH